MGGIRSDLLVWCLACALVVVGCSTASTGDGTPSTSTTSTTSPDSETPSTGASTTTDTAAVAPTTEDLWSERGIGMIATGPADPDGGPHPVLTWQAVDGAATYWLIVQDSAGQPYWAWTGPDSEVRFGGGDRADLNQTAALHEPMTWRVVAFDTDHAVLAFSQHVPIEP